MNSPYPVLPSLAADPVSASYTLSAPSPPSCQLSQKLACNKAQESALLVCVTCGYLASMRATLDAQALSVFTFLGSKTLAQDVFKYIKHIGSQQGKKKPHL